MIYSSLSGMLYTWNEKIPPADRLVVIKDKHSGQGLVVAWNELHELFVRQAAHDAAQAER